MSSLNLDQISVESRPLFTPSLDEVVQVLQKGLSEHFKQVSVSNEPCPDLTQPPFHLTSSGLNGNPGLVEYGGVANLEPLVNKSKIYDLKQLYKITQSKPTFAVGAGAGSFKFASTNCEGVFDITIQNESSFKNGTRVARVLNREKFELLYPANEDTTFALLASFYCSQGLPGNVIKIIAKHRLRPEDFVTTIRQILNNHYKDKVVGLGGVFVIENSPAKHHVMPDFSTTPLQTQQQTNEWLVFKNMTPPLISVGNVISRDLDGLSLRLQHFHSFNSCEGGHYHYDIDAENVSYTAYFNVANTFHRVDKP